MDMFMSLIITIMAEIVSYYICKWLIVIITGWGLSHPSKWNRKPHEKAARGVFVQYEHVCLYNGIISHPIVYYKYILFLFNYTI